MSSFIDSLVEASRRYGVPVMVIGPNGYDYDEADAEDLVPAAALEDPTDEDNESELGQLRAQVQQLTATLQEKERELVTARQASAGAAPAPGGNGGGDQVPAGDYGSLDSQPIDVLGFEDEKLQNKLMRLGHDTVGALRKAFLDATLANPPVKLKKDWLIEVGMKLAGAGPSSAPSNGAAPAPSTSEDVPAGHNDRPWMERLSLAREKQRVLDSLRAELNEKRAEAAKHGDDPPEELDEAIVQLEDDIALTEGQLVAMRWCMGLDPNRDITLDEALSRANLGPWMDNPQPRVAPQTA